MEAVGPDEFASIAGAQSPDVQESEPTTADEHKFGLPFILNVPIRRTRQSALTKTVVVVSPSAPIPRDAKQTLELSKEEKKRRRTCGSEACKKDGCDKKAKARGLCWAHGGGTKCRTVECSKVAVSNGFCWAHGGGKRCDVNGCIKPAYERTLNLCEKHFVHLRHANYFEVCVSTFLIC
ncbi:hypothetical protein JG688_00018120 [Phytophthora aleatoria]|uniref:WRKY19-like zinc finger domain-containing protein n=1 Tax=Phytophthora aleatoria TaxID=2496075 RepID=A0A8J5I9B1_9STRA|nr:hypothetical protein JG688_00018120 [Phytophthora aleatoria]